MSEKRFRFVVSSAEEAVTVLRDRLGERARVVSVRQVEGTGLAKFLKAPKLEVIAEVAPDEPPAPVVPIVPEPTRVVTEAVTMPPAPVAENLVGFPAPAVSAPLEAEAAALASPLVRLLKAGGFSPQVLARLRADRDWQALEKMPVGRALTRVGMLLREEFRSTPQRPLGSRVAFVGSPGAGTTTALCKWVASEVFVHQRGGMVLKLDLDRANPGDALAVFCEALGVRCARSLADVPTLPAGQTLFIDVPGVVPDRRGDVAEVTQALAPLFTTSRVLVVNAAYETTLIKRSYAFAERAGCTHVVFTHLDELTHWGKLWDFLLGGNLTPLFLGTGSNVAGDLEQNVFDAVLARTFPDTGLQAAPHQLAS
jgi:flagellar biosynthesis protein FlhF